MSDPQRGAARLPKVQRVTLSEKLKAAVSGRFVLTMGAALFTPRMVRTTASRRLGWWCRKA